ncbi:GntR family transcriptional regulator [Pseudonocardia sp. WMMC193]|uniref:GntR family transcriptional regulator n=1 Tax=Pseudonocardia sp. WMMC193 TaxID=2911965 RepID=UPI001F392FE9|nr:GntR family transcriptional regulator [Pseudonocardia sp. WMMC193]MCF7549362.1 GntR family transcriptional regulator [Pseudonocardia sp. WMMC193]
MGRLETVSVTTSLIATMRAEILDGKIAPGRGLSENEVAAEYQVSRPTARVAITQLVLEGLLRREGRQQPARVPQLAAADVADLFLVRIPLELEAVDLVAGRAEAHETAGRAVDDLRAIDESRPHSDFVEADLRFHRALVDGIGSPRLSAHYERLTGEIHLSMVQSRSVLGRERIAAEHEAVLDALRLGDVEQARVRMRAHLAGARDAMMAALAKDGEPRRAPVA